MNTVKAVFSGCQKFAIAAPALYQYDYGQVLQIEGLELPTAYQVEFSNSAERGETVAAIGDENGVEIPNELLQTGTNIYAFIFLHNAETDGETEYKITIYVTPRPSRPDDTPTPEQETAIDAAIAALNDAVDRTDASAEAAAGSATSAAGSAAAAADSAEDAAESESNASDSERNAAASATAAGRSATAANNDAIRARESSETASLLADEAIAAASQARTSATAAAQSATNAANSATAAAASAAHADETAESMDIQAGIVIEKALQVALDKQATAASAAAAAQSETNAAASATAAAGSATAAAGSATAAAGSETAAAQSAEDAETAADRAEEAVGSIPDGEITARSFDVKIERFENIAYDEKLVPGVTLSSTASGAVASLLEIDRTVRFQHNPYSVHVRTNTTGTTTDVRVKVPTAFTLLGTQEFEVTMYIPDAAGITDIGFRTLSSGMVKTLSQQADTLQSGWNKCRFFTAGAQAWVEDADTVTIRLIIYHETGTDADIYIGSITQIRPDKGNLIIIEDAGYYSFLTDAYPDLTALGVPVTWGLNFPLDEDDAATRNLINRAELDALRMDGLSEFSFRASYSISSAEQQALTAEGALAETLKCVRLLDEYGIMPQRIFRAVWPYNICPHPELANLEMDASVSYDGSAGVAVYPWRDRYNIPRSALGNQTEDFVDQRFEALRRQHSTVLIYLHGIGTGSGQTSAELWAYFVGKLEAALEAGWLNATTYNRLTSHYAPISTAGVDMTAAVAASKSAADAAASAAKAQRVAESIPADYTALAARVETIGGEVDTLEGTAALIVPSYDASVVYDSNALVLRGGKLYKRKVWSSTPAAEAWTAGHWNQIASLAGELPGKVNTELIALPYSPASTYSAGDIIVRADKLYRAKADVAAENWTAGHWTLIGTVADVVDEVSDLKSSIGQAEAMIATVEPSATASKSYAIGDLLVLGGVLYKVTAAIPAGATITPGSNVTQTTVEAQIAAGGGGVSDVQVNGTSVVSDGIANVPIASESRPGVVGINSSYGISINLNQPGKYLYINPANDLNIKQGIDAYKPISSARQNASTFYGLAKAAGDTTQSASANSVGAYTDAAKAAILTMLGVSDIVGDVEGATASKSYSAGDVFLHDGKLCKATSAIATGDTITIGTNCTRTNLIEILRGA